MSRATVHKTKSKDPPVPAWVIRVCKLGLPKFRVTSGTQKRRSSEWAKTLLLDRNDFIFVFVFQYQLFTL